MSAVAILAGLAATLAGNSLYVHTHVSAGLRSAAALGGQSGRALSVWRTMVGSIGRRGVRGRRAAASSVPAPRQLGDRYG
jgi:hypothetical protein